VREVRRDEVAGPFQLIMRVPVPWVFVLMYLIGAGLEHIWPVRLAGDVSRRVTSAVGAVLFTIGAIIAGWGLVTFEALLLRQAWPAIVLPVVLAYVNWVVIPVEQARLTDVFDAEYVAYQRRVRRWL
jgi:protein-S-isoprenylcysteine O-methyltransferase Ste14